MRSIAKKWIGKNVPLTRKVKRRGPSAKAIAAAADRLERKKIGKTLDLAAFMADLQRDTTSATYWKANE